MQFIEQLLTSMEEQLETYGKLISARTNARRQSCGKTMESLKAKSLLRSEKTLSSPDMEEQQATSLEQSKEKLHVEEHGNRSTVLIIQTRILRSVSI